MAGILELLAEIGEDNLGVQTLHQCMSKNNLGESESEITIETDAITLDNAEFVGAEVKLNKTALICWVDTDKFDAALAKLK